MEIQQLPWLVDASSSPPLPFKDVSWFQLDGSSTTIAQDFLPCPPRTWEALHLPSCLCLK